MSKLNEKVSFWRGKSASIPSTFRSGRFLVEEDTGNAYIDILDYDSGLQTRVQLTDTSMMSKAGGTFTGPVILFRDPIEELEAATKSYVDNVDTSLTTHTTDSGIHVSIEDRKNWDGKVDQESGKGLSSEDFTTEFRTLVESISEGATKAEFVPEYDPKDSELQNFQSLGVITIDGEEYHIYMPVLKEVKGNAETATTLQTAQAIDGVLFDGGAPIQHFAVCTTNGNYKDKVTQIEGFTLVEGASAFILFQNAPTTNTNEVTLNISSTGQVPVYYGEDPVITTELVPGIYHVIYTEQLDSPQYRIVNMTYEVATVNSTGLMSKEDKEKLDGIEEGANNFSIDHTSKTNFGDVKVGQNISVTEGTISLQQSDVTGALGYTPVAGDDLETFLNTIPTFEGAVDSYVDEDNEFVEGHDGIAGIVPEPLDGQSSYFLRGDGTWSPVSGGASDVEPMSEETIDRIISKFLTASPVADFYNFLLNPEFELIGPAVGYGYCQAPPTPGMLTTQVITWNNQIPNDESMYYLSLGRVYQGDNSHIDIAYIPSSSEDFEDIEILNHDYYRDVNGRHQIPWNTFFERRDNVWYGVAPECSEQSIPGASLVMIKPEGHTAQDGYWEFVFQTSSEILSYVRIPVYYDTGE